MLASRSECLPNLSRSVPRPTARRLIEQQNFLARHHRPTALRFEFCSPDSQSAARTSRNRLCPTAIGRILGVVVCQLIDLKGENGSVRSNLGAASNALAVHNSAQSRPIVHNWGPTVSVTACRTGRKILETRFPSSTARFGVRRLILTPIPGLRGSPGPARAERAQPALQSPTCGY